MHVIYDIIMIYYVYILICNIYHIAAKRCSILAMTWSNGLVQWEKTSSGKPCLILLGRDFTGAPRMPSVVVQFMLNRGRQKFASTNFRLTFRNKKKAQWYIPFCWPITQIQFPKDPSRPNRSRPHWAISHPQPVIYSYYTGRFVRRFGRFEINPDSFCSQLRWMLVPTWALTCRYLLTPFRWSHCNSHQ